MIRNLITLKDLLNRVNLTASTTQNLQQYLKIFYLYLLTDTKLENNIDFSAHEKIDSYISDLLNKLTNPEKFIIPEILTKVKDEQIDFSLEGFTFENGKKCFCCGKSSAVIIDNHSINNETLEIIETGFFCLSCFSLFNKKEVCTISPIGVKTNNDIESLDYYGNSVSAAVYEAIKLYDIEKMYLDLIMKYTNEVINQVFKDDEKAHRYFIKLVEELAEDYMVFELAFLKKTRSLYSS